MLPYHFCGIIVNSNHAFLIFNTIVSGLIYTICIISFCGHIWYNEKQENGNETFKLPKNIVKNTKIHLILKKKRCFLTARWEKAGKHPLIYAIVTENMHQNYGVMKGEVPVQRITIKDIARLAGVSVTTVSRALNHAPEISEETRSRILSICAQQGYRTNLLARSLSSSRTHVIGVVMSDISRPIHAALALYIETYAAQLGYQVMLCNGQPREKGIHDLFDFLLGQRVDGILMASASNSAHALLARYQSAVPTVLLGTFGALESTLRFNSVSVDNYVGGRLAAEYLHRLGHREVAYLGMREGSSSHQLRQRGFLDGAAQAGMKVTTGWNRESHSTAEVGYRLARGLFLKPFRQTAVFAASDLVALGVMQAADELGVSIPEQVSLLGFDDIDYAALPKIRLTTFSQRTDALARSGVRLLMELIENGDGTEFTQRLLTPTLVERSTCRSILK